MAVITAVAVKGTQGGGGGRLLSKAAYCLLHTKHMDYIFAYGCLSFSATA